MERSVLDDLGAEITGIISPVSICMAVTVLLVRILNSEGASSSNTVVIASIAYAEQSGDSSSDKIKGALLNAIIFVSIVAAMTFVLVLLFKYRCYKVIYGYLGFAVFNIFFFLTGALVIQLMQKANIHMDAFSYCFLLFNFSVIGTSGLLFVPLPLLMKQCYLVWTGIITAYIFTFIPEWTTWVLLCMMAIYDILAVLVPGGPLRVLVDLVQTRNEELPGALIYEARPVGRPYQPGVWNRNTAQPVAEAEGVPVMAMAPGLPVAGLGVGVVPSPERGGHPGMEMMTRDVHSGGVVHQREAGGSGGRPLGEGRETPDPPMYKPLAPAPEASSSRSSAQRTPLSGPPDITRNNSSVPLLQQGAGDSPTSSVPDESEEVSRREPRRRPDSLSPRPPSSSSVPAVAPTPAAGEPYNRGGSRGSRSSSRQAQSSAVSAAAMDDAGGEPRGISGGRLPVSGMSSGTDMEAQQQQQQRGNGGERGGQSQQQLPAGQQEEEYEDDDRLLPDSIKLGLGDFIFYSVLVGRAAMYDMMTVFAAYLAIMAGLGLTLLCLAVYKMALPALPFSIALGVMFYFVCRLVLEPYVVPLSSHYVYF